MKFKGIVFFIGVFAIIYSIVMLLVSPFLISWGEKPSIFKRIFNLLTNFPVDWNYLVVKYSFIFIYINGLFWGVIVSMTYLIIKRLIK